MIGGAFEGIVGDIVSPFGYRRGEGIDAGFGERDWICERDRERTDPLFYGLSPVDGKISGSGEFPNIDDSLKCHHFTFNFIVL